MNKIKFENGCDGLFTDRETRICIARDEAGLPYSKIISIEKIKLPILY